MDLQPTTNWQLGLIMLRLTSELKGHTMDMKLRFRESEIDHWANRYTERHRISMVTGALM